MKTIVRRFPRVLLPISPVFVFLAVLSGGPLAAQDQAAKPLSFHNQIHPILQRKCQGCHQPAKANGKLILTTFDSLMKGGEGGTVVEPGKPDESLLIEQITGDSPAMPKNAPPLSAAEVDLLNRWIAQGAKDDTPAAAKDPIDQDHPPVYT